MALSRQIRAYMTFIFSFSWSTTNDILNLDIPASSCCERDLVKDIANSDTMSSYRAPDKNAITAASDLDNEAGLHLGLDDDPGRHAPNHASSSPQEQLGDFRAVDPHSGVKRGLKTRHLSMMALAGIIGPGLLVGSGGALASGGPAALLIGFGVIGLVAFSIMQSLGELTTLYPSGGAFVGLADRFVDKAFGVAVGWNYFIIWVAVLANEYNTTCSILVFWSDKVPLWGYFLILWVSSLFS